MAKLNAKTSRFGRCVNEPLDTAEGLHLKELIASI